MELLANRDFFFGGGGVAEVCIYDPVLMLFVMEQKIGRNV